MDGRMDAYLERAQELVDEHGWMVQGVAGAPAWYYTVGVSEKAEGLPELVLVAIHPEAAISILNTFARKLASAEFVLDEAAIERGDKFEGVIPDYPAKLRWLTAAENKELSVAHRLMSKPFRAVQIIWPDANGLFEGEAGFNKSFSGRQSMGMAAVGPGGVMH